VVIVFPRVNHLETVNKAVGFVEVAIGIVVVKVLEVVGLQVGFDLGQRLPGVQLALDPVGHGIAHDEPCVLADEVCADCRVDIQDVTPPAVTGFVERDFDPAVDVPVDGISVRRLRFVVVGGAVEVDVFVVGFVEVRYPDRRIVDCAVRLRDLVMERTLKRERRDRGRWVVGVREVRVAEVAELNQKHEHTVGPLPLKFDVLATSDFDHLVRAPGGCLSGDDLFERLLAQGRLPLGNRVRELIRLPAVGAG
jgi:hypothetical protein